VMEDEVGAMLGLTSEARLRALVAALVAQDAPALFAAMSQLAQGAPDYAEVLAELLQLFHALAVQQLMPEADAELFEASPALVAEFATQVSPDAVQLLYQIALHGRRDLPLAPSPRLGLEMTMMRMLAFAPQAETGAPQAEAVVPAQAASPASMARTPVPTAPRVQEVDARPAQVSSRSAPQAAIQAALQAAGVAPRASKPAEKPAVVSPPVMNQPVMSEPSADDSHRPPIEPAPVQPEAVKPLGDWHSVLPRLGLKGMALQLAENLELVAQEGDKITLRCPASHASVRSSVSEKALAAALGKQLGLNAAVRLQFVEGVPEQATPAQLRQQAQDARQQQALDSLRNDPLVRTLEDKYAARLLEDTVRPLDEN